MCQRTLKVFCTICHCFCFWIELENAVSMNGSTNRNFWGWLKFNFRSHIYRTQLVCQVNEFISTSLQQCVFSEFNMPEILLLMQVWLFLFGGLPLAYIAYSFKMIQAHGIQLNSQMGVRGGYLWGGHWLSLIQLEWCLTFELFGWILQCMQIKVCNMHISTLNMFLNQSVIFSVKKITHFN